MEHLLKYSDVPGQRLTYRLSDSRHLSEITVLTLKDHREILSLSWSRMRDALRMEDDNSFHNVYHFGWGHDERTRKLRDIFVKLLGPLDRKLEDYL